MVLAVITAVLFCKVQAATLGIPSVIPLVDTTVILYSDSGSSPVIVYMLAVVVTVVACSVPILR